MPLLAAQWQFGKWQLKSPHRIFMLTTVFNLLQNEAQTTAVLAAFTHNNWSPGGLAGPSLLLPVFTRCPLPERLHDKHPGSGTSCGGLQLRPCQVTAVAKAAAVLQASDEVAFLHFPRVPSHTKDFKNMQSKSEQDWGFFPPDEERTRL